MSNNLNIEDIEFDDLTEFEKLAIRGFWDYPIGPFSVPSGVRPEVWYKYTYGSEQGSSPVPPVEDDLYFIVKQ